MARIKIEESSEKRSKKEWRKKKVVVKTAKEKPQLKTIKNKGKIEVGLDECARSPVFGRCYVGAVVWPTGLVPPDDIRIEDSKNIKTEKQRKKSADWIKANVTDYAIGWLEPEEINETKNIGHSIHQGWTNCLDSLEVDFDMILVDGKHFKGYRKLKNKEEDDEEETREDDEVDYETVVKGDSKYYCIAAASILAKSAHDTYIQNLVEETPEIQERYDIKNNKGYPRQKHLDGIAKHGICQYHRRHFEPCSKAPINPV